MHNQINEQGLEPSSITEDPQILARYNILYLGTAIPLPNEHGIDSVQLPLSKRYPINGEKSVRGIETWVSVNKNDFQIQFAHDPSVMLYYPIQSLVYCAGVRYATRTETGDEFPDNWRFVRLDSRDATQFDNLPNPPLFAIIFRRTRSSPVNECHCFMAKTKRIALALVQACFDAYKATDFPQDCSKVPIYFKIDFDNDLELKEIDGDINIVPALDEEKEFDYQINPHCTGYFYKLNDISVDNWQIFEHRKSRRNRSSSSLASRRSKTPISEVREKSPNVAHAERIKDPNTGRDAFVRWIDNPSENQHSKISKKKTRKHKHRERKISEEHYQNSSSISLASQQQFPNETPNTVFTLELPFQPNFQNVSSPFWVFTV